MTNKQTKRTKGTHEWPQAKSIFFHATESRKKQQKKKKKKKKKRKKKSNKNKQTNKKPKKQTNKRQKKKKKKKHKAQTMLNYHQMSRQTEWIIVSWALH